jgi:hypothetical protein
MARAKKTSANDVGTMLTGPALEDALTRGSIDSPKPQLIGMVKASTARGYISFAPAGCESWVEFPSSLIAEAQQLGYQPCEDHSHPLFRLVLSEPADKEAKALVAILTSRSRPPVMAIAASPTLGDMMAPGGQGAPGAMRTRQCSSFCSGSTMWCMCPVYVPGLGWTYSLFPCGTCINDPVFTALTAFA